MPSRDLAGDRVGQPRSGGDMAFFSPHLKARIAWRRRYRTEPVSVCPWTILKQCTALAKRIR
jgi:hypothetical protein